MPVYDYRCPDGHEFEAWRKIGTHSSAPCPSCGKEAKRLWRTTPKVIMRPEGYNLRPGEPGYDSLPKTDRKIYKWQMK